MEALAKTINHETGRVYQPPIDGQSFKDVYRAMVTNPSGRFALLDDGLGFSFVPWRPVIEQSVGRQISAVVLGDYVSWSLGRERGLSL
jgi:Protein of unknown function (DUF3363)